MSKTEKQTAYLVDKNTGRVEAWALLGSGGRYVVIERDRVAIRLEVDTPQGCVCLSVPAVVDALRKVVERKARGLKRAQKEQRLAQDRLTAWTSKARNEKGAEEIEG